MIKELFSNANWLVLCIGLAYCIAAPLQWNKGGSGHNLAVAYVCYGLASFALGMVKS